MLLILYVFVNFCSKLLTAKTILPAHAFSRSLLLAAIANQKKPSLSDAMLKELQDRCPNLVEFSLMHLDTNTISAALLPPKAQQLSITSSHVPTGWYRAIPENNLMPDLCFLDLTGSSKTSNIDLKDLCSRKKIQTLKLNGCYRVTDEGCKTVAETLSGLTHLEISETQCTDLALHHISRNLGDLLHLDFSKCGKVTDGGVATVASLLKKLESLKMNRCYKIQEGGLKAVAENLKRLTVLEIADTACTDTVLGDICGNLTELQRLNLTRCGKVTDVEMVNVSRSLSKLQWLSLEQCTEVSDKSVEAFHLLTCLQYLNVNRTKVTNTARDELQAALKHCQIVLDN